MKTNILILIIGFFALLAAAAVPETSQEIIIGVSPFQSVTERTKQLALLQRFVVADAPNGSRVIVWDAWELRVICDVQLPALRFDSPAARVPRVAPALTALKQWFAELDRKQVPPGLKETEAIAVPQWLQAATAQSATGRRTIIVLASPLCFVPNEPAFSMVETHYPSDGHLNSGDKSIYSVTDKRGRLANNIILWAYPTETVWASPHHREQVARWWSLFIAGQGPNAMLCAFNSDATQVMRDATHANHRAIGEYAVNMDDAALVMHTAEQREVPVKIQQARLAPLEPVPQPMAPVELPSTPVIVVVPPATAPSSVSEPEPPAKAVAETAIAVPMPSEIPKPAVGNVGIAAVWNAERGTDIDLWVAAKPGLPEAYWNRPRVERVRYFRDIRTPQAVKNNAQWQAVWEYCEVERAQVSDPTLWLNVYAAKGPVSGIVRVQFEGRIVDCPFQFNVANGNRGRDSNIATRSRSPYWLEIRLDEVFQNVTTNHVFNTASK